MLVGLGVAIAVALWLGKVVRQRLKKKPTTLREYAKVSKDKHIRGVLELFDEADADGSGSIDHDEFCELFELGRDYYSTRLMDMFDTDGDGSVSFEEFVCGLSQFREGGEEGRVKFVFTLLDVDRSGSLSRLELQDVIFKHAKHLMGGPVSELTEEEKVMRNRMKTCNHALQNDFPRELEFHFFFRLVRGFKDVFGKPLALYDKFAPYAEPCAKAVDACVAAGGEVGELVDKTKASRRDRVETAGWHFRPKSDPDGDGVGAAKARTNWRNAAQKAKGGAQQPPQRSAFERASVTAQLQKLHNAGSEAGVGLFERLSLEERVRLLELMAERFRAEPVKEGGIKCGKLAVGLLAGLPGKERMLVLAALPQETKDEFGRADSKFERLLPHAPWDPVDRIYDKQALREGRRVLLPPIGGMSVAPPPPGTTMMTIPRAAAVGVHEAPVPASRTRASPAGGLVGPLPSVSPNESLLRPQEPLPPPPKPRPPRAPPIEEEVEEGRGLDKEYGEPTTKNQAEQSSREASVAGGGRGAPLPPLFPLAMVPPKRHLSPPRPSRGDITPAMRARRRM